MITSRVFLNNFEFQGFNSSKKVIGFPGVQFRQWCSDDGVPPLESRGGESSTGGLLAVAPAFGIQAVGFHI